MTNLTTQPTTNLKATRELLLGQVGHFSRTSIDAYTECLDRLAAIDAELDRRASAPTPFTCVHEWAEYAPGCFGCIRCHCVVD